MMSSVRTSSANYTGLRRFQEDAVAHYGAFSAAARDYVAKLEQEHRRGLIEKPLDWRPGHPTYFTAMQQLLGALRTLELAPGSRIIEVGSGAGWATEILASLWYRVECIEPSEAMIKVARRRVREHLRQRGCEHFMRRVTWRASTLEDARLEGGCADAVIFFESFHHIVDERIALAKTWDALRPGGQIVILGDSNWIPGNVEQETAWRAEMAAYGTLESPFTAEYLGWLLNAHGFVDIKRNHLLDGLAPVEAETQPARNFALLDAAWNNLFTATKPTDPFAPVRDAYPYGRPLDDAPPSSPMHGLRRITANALRRLADLVG